MRSLEEWQLCSKGGITTQVVDLAFSRIEENLKKLADAPLGKGRGRLAYDARK
jgi:hypothetical protein